MTNLPNNTPSDTHNIHNCSICANRGYYLGADHYFDTITSPSRQSLEAEIAKIQNRQYDKEITIAESIQTLLKTVDRYVMELIGDAVAVVEDEYQKSRTIGRKNDDGDTRLFVEVTLPQCIKDRLLALRQQVKGSSNEKASCIRKEKTKNDYN